MLTILVGMSGSGKDAIQRELVYPDNQYDMERVVTATTRPMREGEQDGVDYLFMSREDFQKGIENDVFIEHRAYDTLVEGEPDTWFYGSPKQELDPNKDYCIILDLQGAKAFVDHYGVQNCFVAEVVVRDDIREQRAMERGSFDKSEWDRRLVDDTLKFSPSRTEGIVNFKVDNTYGSVDDAVGSILDALEAYQRQGKEPDKHYVVHEESYSYGYYDPPETEYKVYDAEWLKDMHQAELESGIEISLHENLSSFLATTHGSDYFVASTSLHDNHDDDDRLFTAVVSIGKYCDGGVHYMDLAVAPFPDQKALVYAIDGSDYAHPIPKSDEKQLEDALKAGITDWMENISVYEFMVKKHLGKEFDGYMVIMSPDSVPEQLHFLDEKDFFRLAAELTAIQCEKLSDEQKAVLGENYNPYYNSEIIIDRGSGMKPDKLTLVELFDDELEMMTAYATYMSKDYHPELVQTKEVPKDKPIERGE